ncbi:DUF6233 domain-containing protein [Streptomyces sp. NPDC054904]
MHTGDCWDTRTRCEAATTDADREALAEGIPVCPHCRPYTPRSASSTATATYPEMGGRPGGHLLLPHCTGAHHHHVSGFHTSGPAPRHVVRCRGRCSHLVRASSSRRRPSASSFSPSCPSETWFPLSITPPVPRLVQPSSPLCRQPPAREPAWRWIMTWRSPSGRKGAKTATNRLCVRRRGKPPATGGAGARRVRAADVRTAGTSAASALWRAYPTRAPRNGGSCPLASVARRCGSRQERLPHVVGGLLPARARLGI